METKKVKVGLSNINVSFGDQTYFPYSLGLLQAYALENLSDPDEFEFGTPLYRKIPVKKGVEQLYKSDMAFFSLSIWNAELSKTIAKKLKSRRLLLMTDVEAVLDKNKKLISEITPDIAKKMMDEDIITGGMIPKINTCIDAINKGVKGVVIIDGRRHHSILFELLSDKGMGTLIRE